MSRRAARSLAPREVDDVDEPPGRVPDAGAGPAPTTRRTARQARAATTSGRHAAMPPGLPAEAPERPPVAAPSTGWSPAEPATTSGRHARAGAALPAEARGGASALAAPPVSAAPPASGEEPPGPVTRSTPPTASPGGVAPSSGPLRSAEAARTAEALARTWRPTRSGAGEAVADLRGTARLDDVVVLRDGAPPPAVRRTGARADHQAGHGADLADDPVQDPGYDPVHDPLGAHGPTGEGVAAVRGPRRPAPRGGALLVVAGLVLVVAALLCATLLRPTRTTTASVQLAGGSPVVVAAAPLLGARPSTVVLRGRGPVVLAVGRADDVAAWVGSSARTAVAAAGDGAPLAARAVAGAAPPDPTGSDLWVAQSRGQRRVVLHWPGRPGRWSLVGAGASATPPTSLAVSRPAAAAPVWAWPLAAAGLLVAGVGLLRARRARPARRRDRLGAAGGARGAA